MAEDQDTHEWYTYNAKKTGGSEMTEDKMNAKVDGGFYYGKDITGCYFSNGGKAAVETNILTLYGKEPIWSYEVRKGKGCYLERCPEEPISDIRISKKHKNDV